MVENLVGYAKTDLMIPPGAERAVHRLCGGQRGSRGVVCRGQRRGAFGDLRGAGSSGWSSSGSCCAPLPSLRPEIGPADHPQGRPAVLHPVRLGPLLGAGPVDRAARCAASSSADRTLSIIAGPVRVRWSPSTCWSPRAGPRSTMSTTAGPARRHGGRCAREPWRRRRSARSARPRRRS